MTLEKNMNQLIIDALKEKFGEIFESNEFRAELTIVVPQKQIETVCRFLKGDPRFRYEYLADLFGFDMNTAENRFGVVYNMFSFMNKHRLRLKTFIQNAEQPSIATVTGVWRTANFHERETFDMFGIIFEGHPDLRRIYMPDEFEYYPLRKDFPLMGIPGSLQLPKKHE
jgi:NADH-quinone oxidoreductase subunit C